MPSFTERFKFIGHALAGDGPFRPVVTENGLGVASLAGASALVRYPRESEEKYARRNDVAFFDNPMAQAVDRFVGYLYSQPTIRSYPHDLYAAMAEDVDGKDNDIDVFWQQFSIAAKARGSMLLLVDMPAAVAPNLAEQLQARVAPYWAAIAPELITDYQIGDDGKFDFAEFSGSYTRPDGEKVPCRWRFDRAGWECRDQEKRLLDAGDHPLGECPLLIFTEGGDFPHFGSFSPIADLSRRLFNLDSELDEIMRSQTFSLLTMQVPENSPEQQKLQAAQTAGQTISSSNLLVHSGSTPAFIAPPDGPARIYMDRIDQIRDRIDQIGLNVNVQGGSKQKESGIALQMRFQALNGELSRFAARMEDLERRAWSLSQRWLGLSMAPEIGWSRDYNLSDVATELTILADMQASAMPTPVIVEQQKRIAVQQFCGLESKRKDELMQAIDERGSAIGA